MSLNSLKVVFQGVISGTIIGVIKGDTRSLDSSSHAKPSKPSNSYTALEEGPPTPGNPHMGVS